MEGSANGSTCVCVQLLCFQAGQSPPPDWHI